MKTMSMKALFCAATVALTAGISARADAQTVYDHLKCFKAKDVKTFKKATADLTVGPGHLAGLQNCTISGGAKEFCIPVRKTNVVVVDGSDTPLANTEDQDFDRLCYKLKCPANDPGAQAYMDQFGARTIDGFKVASICTPVIIGPVPTQAPPTWPSTPQTYVPEESSYVDTLTVPAVSMGVPTCCKDFGAISRDKIEHNTNNADNALAKLADQLAGLGIDIQGALDTAIQDGDLVILLDHKDMDPLALPDQFTLAQFIGSFAPGTDYTLASSGLGAFFGDTDSFVPGTGEPRNWYHPAVMGTPAMNAGPFTLSLSLPFGFLTLNVSAEQATISGDHGTITAAGVPYTNGKISGFVLMDDIYADLNALLNSTTCTCLNLTTDVYHKLANGQWSSAGTCIADAATRCPNASEESCVTLAGGPTLVFGPPPQVCGVLPGLLNAQADIDLNSSPTVYEGLSIGLGYTAKNATWTVP